MHRVEGRDWGVGVGVGVARGLMKGKLGVTNWHCGMKIRIMYATATKKIPIRTAANVVVVVTLTVSQFLNTS